MRWMGWIGQLQMFIVEMRIQVEVILVVSHKS